MLQPAPQSCRSLRRCGVDERAHFDCAKSLDLLNASEPLRYIFRSLLVQSIDQRARIKNELKFTNSIFAKWDNIHHREHEFKLSLEFVGWERITRSSHHLHR
jgi:chromosome condensin MukBEF ATPase and DNA-binding subunit MukB